MEALEKIDVLLIDLQDVGTRVYTYTTTIGLCLEAAARSAGTKVAVLDRPNPINGTEIEGNVLEPAFRSFVGRYPVPMRHGLTAGEFARFVCAEANHRLRSGRFFNEGLEAKPPTSTISAFIGFTPRPICRLGRPPCSTPAWCFWRGQISVRGGARQCRSSFSERLF